VGPSPRPCRGAARRRDIAFIAALAVAALAAVATLAPASCKDTGGGYPDLTFTELPAVEISGAEARVLAFGDSGTGDGNQRAVAAGMASRIGADPFDFALMLGDNFYESGVSGVEDPQFDSKFRQTYPPEPFAFPFYVALGNHDYRGDAQAQYDYEDPEGRWRCPGPAYLLPVRFAAESLVDVYSVDSTMALGGFRGPKIAQWIAERIAERSAAYSVLALHHALYSSGIHGDSPELLALFAGSLGAGKIRIVLSGHDHDQELQERDADGDGILETFIVSGSAGKSRPVAGGPHTLFADAAYGFAELALRADGYTVSFFDAGGTLLYSRDH
jgi:acid phosphatase